MRAEEFDQDMDKTFVQKTDDNTGLASHRGVDRVAREEIAE